METETGQRYWAIVPEPSFPHAFTRRSLDLTNAYWRPCHQYREYVHRAFKERDRKQRRHLHCGNASDCQAAEHCRPYSPAWCEWANWRDQSFVQSSRAWEERGVARLHECSESYQCARFFAFLCWNLEYSAPFRVAGPSPTCSRSSILPNVFPVGRVMFPKGAASTCRFLRQPPRWGLR